MGFTLTTILLATLAASMAPRPSLAVLTEVGLGRMVDIVELNVTVDFQTTHKTFGLAEAAWFEKAIIESINDVFLENELHAYGAKLKHSSRRRVSLRGSFQKNGEVLQGQEDAATFDDVVELAEEALALEALIMDEGTTIEKVRSEVSNLSRSWGKKKWGGSAMISVNGECQMCSPDYDNVGGSLAKPSGQTKMKRVEKDLSEILRREGFGNDFTKVLINFTGRDLEGQPEKRVFAPVLEGPALAGDFAAN